MRTLASRSGATLDRDPGMEAIRKIRAERSNKNTLIAVALTIAFILGMLAQSVLSKVLDTKAAAAVQERQ
jgi:hypothetical protein